MPSSDPSGRRAVQEEKLAFLREQEAILSDLEQKFQIRKRIQELERELDEIPRESRWVWNVPRRNPFFTGREDVLDALHRALHDGGRAAIGQAITGLGGIGKTQTAVEYCHRRRDDYDAVFWVRAETVGDVRSGLVEVARLLGLPAASAPEQDTAVKAVVRWLEAHDGWLLVFDNVDRPDLLEPFLPSGVTGQILLTSRATDLAAVGFREPFRMKTLPPAEARAFLLGRAERNDASGEERKAVAELARELGYLPLALEQAAAYVAASGARFQSYLDSFREHQLEVIEKMPPKTGGYPASVATTWALSFYEVGKTSPASADLLRALAFLAPDAIPLEIFATGAEFEPPLAEALGKGSLAESDLLRPLRAYSLIERDTEAGTVSVHRLVQVVTRKGLGKEAERSWAEQVVRAVAQVFPRPEFETWPKCERLYPQALEIERLAEGMSLALPEAGRVLNEAGLYAKKRARYEEAELLCKRAIDIYERALGPEHPHVATALDNLANLCRTQGRYEEAEALYERELAISESAPEVDDPDVAWTLNNLAELYRDQGRDSEAKPLYERALNIAEKALGEEHPHIATLLNNLAELYRDQRDYEQAEPLYERCLALQENALGPDHPAVAVTLNNLAHLYRDQGLYDKTEPLYKRSLSLQGRALGPDHPAVATAVNSLAELYRMQGRYTEANPLYERSLAIREKVFSSGHPTVAATLNNLAVLYTAQGRYEEAEPLLKRSLAIRGPRPDRVRLATALNNLAELYRVQERYGDAEPLYERSLALREEALGPEAPAVATVLNNLALLYRAQGRYEEAESLFTRSLAIWKSAPGPEVSHVVYATLGLAGNHHGRGSLDDAESLFQHSVTLGESALGQDHPLTVEARRRYSDFLATTGRAVGDLSEES